MVRWAARHVSPECRVGCSLVCRVMAKPSWKAFEAFTDADDQVDGSKQERRIDVYDWPHHLVHYKNVHYPLLYEKS